MRKTLNVIFAAVSLLAIIAIGVSISSKSQRVQNNIKVKEKANCENIKQDEENYDMIFTLPESVTEITSQGYYEEIIRLSGEKRNNKDITFDKKVLYPNGMIIGSVIEEDEKKKFIAHKNDVLDIINIIENSKVSNNKVSNVNIEKDLNIKLLLLNSKTQYILSTVRYIGNNEFEMHIDFPEEREIDNERIVIIESDKLLQKIQEIV